MGLVTKFVVDDGREGVRGQRANSIPLNRAVLSSTGWEGKWLWSGGTRRRIFPPAFDNVTGARAAVLFPNELGRRTRSVHFVRASGRTAFRRVKRCACRPCWLQIDGVVIRINCGGGDALGSDLLWREVCTCTVREGARRWVACPCCFLPYYGKGLAPVLLVFLPP